MASSIQAAPAGQEGAELTDTNVPKDKRPVDSWSEEEGPVLWWTEAGPSYLGEPGAADWPEDREFLWWSPLDDLGKRIVRMERESRVSRAMPAPTTQSPKKSQGRYDCEALAKTRHQWKASRCQQTAEAYVYVLEVVLRELLLDTNGRSADTQSDT